MAAVNVSALNITPFESDAPDLTIHIVKTPTDGGIKEDVSPKYRERFEKWKSELLATELGRDQWNKYANNKSFVLTIVVSGDRKGAGTDKYQWNDEGKLVGATITLSAALEDGSPPPIYYPVLNSLSTDAITHSVSRTIVAATRLSHELGHVNQTAEANMNLIQTQNKLMLQYNSIFVENGLNSKDARLLDLAGQMNGTPVQIWESREYWSEVNAMRYLSQRINKENFYCFVFKKIRRNIETYAKAYEDRFSQYPEFTNSPCWD
ncbi:MAG: hypothetical protein DMF63_16505 [Acidobacteria bacterium]|nr:MAG: hypothetical protein DMF63_16505 [Acidobacteriota bacterium]